MRITINNINKALEAAGIKGELVKGEGYFYFFGESFDGCVEQGVYGVFRLTDLSVERWVQEAKAKIEEARN